MIESSQGLNNRTSS